MWRFLQCWKIRQHSLAMLQFTTQLARTPAVFPQRWLLNSQMPEFQVQAAHPCHSYIQQPKYIVYDETNVRNVCFMVKVTTQMQRCRSSVPAAFLFVAMLSMSLLHDASTYNGPAEIGIGGTSSTEWNMAYISVVCKLWTTSKPHFPY